MEKINATKDPEGFMSWAVIELLAQFSERTGEPLPVRKGTPNIVDVELKINGKEMEFTKLIDLMDKQWTAIVQREAKKMLESKLGEVTLKLTEVCEEITETVWCSELGEGKD